MRGAANKCYISHKQISRNKKKKRNLVWICSDQYEGFYYQLLLHISLPIYKYAYKQKSFKTFSHLIYLDSLGVEYTPKTEKKKKEIENLSNARFEKKIISAHGFC